MSRFRLVMSTVSASARDDRAGAKVGELLIKVGGGAAAAYDPNTRLAQAGERQLQRSARMSGRSGRWRRGRPCPGACPVIEPRCR